MNRINNIIETEDAISHYKISLISASKIEEKHSQLNPNQIKFPGNKHQLEFYRLILKKKSPELKNKNYIELPLTSLILNTSIRRLKVD